MKRFVYILILSLVTAVAFAAADSLDSQLYQDGIEELRNERFDQASLIFRNVLDKPELSRFHADALFALAKSEQAQKHYRDASNLVDRFLATYPSNEKFQEALYMRGRLLHLEGENDKAIVALERFIGDYPDSVLVSSAYYWIGEALMALGRLEEADSIFALVLEKYPSSVKREASRYRRTEIKLLFREKELLDILKWSHQEYLRETEDFYRREDAYRAALEARPPQDGESAVYYRERLLDVKERLLALKSYYTDQLMKVPDAR